MAATYLQPKPRNFTRADPNILTRERMLFAVQNGRPNTGMKSFASVITPEEMEAVVDFIRLEFMQNKDINTLYHTPENGWFDHERYAIAFPFAKGDIPIDTSPDELTAEQQEGLKLFMNSCVSCHDRAKVNSEGVIWDKMAVSFPRKHYSHRDPPQTDVDALTSATPYAVHDIVPLVDGLTEQEKQGEFLFQENCAFCHGADGTGKNWIGTFLEPHARDLTNPDFMSGMTRTRLRQVIREGLKDTSMPAWKDVLSDEQIEAVMAYINRVMHPLRGE